MEDKQEIDTKTVEANRMLVFGILERIMTFSEVTDDRKIDFEEMVDLMKKALNMR